MTPLATPWFWIVLGLLCLNLRADDLKWAEGPGYRSAPLPVPTSGRTGFTRLTPAQTGIYFTNVLTDAKAAENQIRLNGSGVACGDVDGDGRCDLYFCGLESGNKLYRNLGNWKFEDITDSAGVACTGQFSTGCVFADVDGDGDLDLLVNSIGGGTRLFLNDGKGHFTEATNSGLLRKFGGMTMTLADIDGNGTLDLYVANYLSQTIRSTGLSMLRINGRLALRPEDRDDFQLSPEGRILELGEPDQLYLNDGKGRFASVSWTDGRFRDEDGQPLRGAPRDLGLSAMFHDLNGDGAPDLYVANDFQTPDRVWINNGRGEFRAIAPLALRHTSTFSMSIDVADINRDGFDDLFVADMLGRGHRRQMLQAAGTEPYPRTIGLFERLQLDRNTLQLNRGDGTYADIAYFSGLEASDWTWSAIFMDVDLDGYEDLLMTTGQKFDPQDVDANARIAAIGPVPRDKFSQRLLMYPPLPLPKMAFRNRGDLTFEEIGNAWGFCDAGVAHGMALADLDNDGDLDVVVNQLNGPAGIYRNETAGPRIAVRLKGLPPNTQGIGGRISVLGGPVPQSAEVICGGHYLSGSDPMRVFAAGSPTNILKIEVTWPGGQRSVIKDARPNYIYEIDQAGARSGRGPAPKAFAARRDPPSPVGYGGQAALALPGAWFEDVSRLIAHTHHDELFDDFARQPTLGKRLSQLGPGVCWFDLNGDGFDDLVIGSGKGGSLSVFLNDGKGGFQAVHGLLPGQPLTRDQTAIVAWPGTSNAPVLLVGSANYEDGLAAGASVLAYDLKHNKVSEAVPGTEASVGPMALGDLDGNGHLALFVGGRAKPGRYPEAASSRIFRERNGAFVLDETNSKALENAGLVSGAVWSDLDGDGFPELILACEWGPIRIFHNDHGRLTAWDPPVTIAPPSAAHDNSPAAAVEARVSSHGVLAPLTLSQLTGWWNGVSAGDFDGDGRMDFVASNWGLNTACRTRPDHPRHIYFGDLIGDGGVSVIDAHYDDELAKEVPDRDLDALAAVLPSIRARFPKVGAYASASIAEVLGDKLGDCRKLGVETLESMLFLNRGDHFEAVPLPPEAQWAPAFAVVVGDLDGDGCEDVFLSQNFFATHPTTEPSDSGRGLWLKGDGKGGLKAVSGLESGLCIYGEQRGAAICDYDADGRADLVVTQNGAETKLYHNVGAKPGLRVRLQGSAGNPDGIGAVLRLKFNGRWGPARELHAGSGYWSQDSPVQVLGTPEPPTQIEVRWPGGKTVAADVPAGAAEVRIGFDGKLTRMK